VTVRARGSGDGVFQGYDSRLQATTENRWQGGNLAHYANPMLDQLLDRLFVTLDEREQERLRRELLEIFATDLPVMPVYFAVSFGVVRKGVVALRDDFAAPGGVARKAHVWDRQS
jgi:ABC-type transport system substrate-binding protein